MDLKSAMLSEINQTHNLKYCLVSHVRQSTNGEKSKGWTKETREYISCK